jgi:GPH family glycoside/pentoside/hexuronide:cation symporter
LNSNLIYKAGVVMSVTERVSQRVMLSYGVGKFLAEFFGQAFLVIGFFYYETVVQLDLGLTALAFILYSLWNAVNDPLIGYFTEKKQTRFTQKYGRRFPWILSGSLLYAVSFILIFAIPETLTDQIVIFLWLLISICLFDFLFSLWDVSYQSLFPDKFRTEELRNRTAGYGAGIGVFGIAFGFILAGSLTDSNVYSSYITAAFIFAFIGIIAVLLMVLGVKETPDMIERYLQDRQMKQEDSFIKELISALRTRNFFAWIILYLFYQSAVVSLVSSIEYIGDYILPPDTSTLLIFVGYLLGALLTIPMWLRFAKRVQSNQRMLMITACVMVVALLPMTFASSLIEFSSLAAVMGIGFGGYWMLMNPALADVIDEIVVKTGKRNDGIYMGFRAFFGRLAIAIQALIFLFVHELTGFVPRVEQTESAKLGINLHTATIPAIILICGVIIFWFLNTLTSEEVASNKIKLKELKL